LASRIVYDWHERKSLLDHFLHPATTLEDFASARYGEQGDFVLAGYEVISKTALEGFARLSMRRKGTVWVDGEAVAVEVAKTIAMTDDKNGSWECDYEIFNHGSKAAKLWFGSELCFAFSEEAAGKKQGQSIRSVRFEDKNNGSVEISSDKEFNLWTFPLHTVSQSEGGFERTYQGTAALVHHRLEIQAGHSFKFRLSAKTYES